MLTFYTEPNYVLAMSGGVLYSYLAYWIYESMVSIAFLSSMLALTSIWFHSAKTMASFWMDQVMIYVWTIRILYASYERGWIPFVLGLGCLGYGVVLFYWGQRTMRYAYDPRRHVSTAFHVSVHLLSTCVAIYNFTLALPDNELGGPSPP